MQKLEKKSLVSFIPSAPPSMTMQAKFSTAPRIQLNDSYKSTRIFWTSSPQSAISSAKPTVPR